MQRCPGVQLQIIHICFHDMWCLWCQTQDFAFLRMLVAFFTLKVFAFFFSFTTLSKPHDKMKSDYGLGQETHIRGCPSQWMIRDFFLRHEWEQDTRFDLIELPFSGISVLVSKEEKKNPTTTTSQEKKRNTKKTQTHPELSYAIGYYPVLLSCATAVHFQHIML